MVSEVKVSVIIPVYNSERFLRQCLDSICSQTLKEIEIICVDDSSTDGSMQILEQYKKLDDRIRLICNKHTGYGAASARNAGLKAAGGEYLSFLDSDDYFHPELLERAYKRAADVNADIVLYDAQRFDNATGRVMPSGDILVKDVLPEKEVFNHNDYADYVFISTMGAAWEMLVKREFIMAEQLEFQSLYHADDFFFSYSALAAAERISVIKDVLLYYRLNTEGSQSANKARYPLAAPMACLRLKQWLKERGLYNELSNAYANISIRYLAWYLNTMGDYDGFLELYEAISNKYLRELELEDALVRNCLPFDADNWLKLIKSGDAAAYLYSCMPQNNNSVFEYSTDKIFPENMVASDDRVILYGAGNVGKAFYVQNALKGYCNIVGWVDRQASRLYLPVEEVDIVKTCKFDRLLIAIENPQIAKQAASDLIQMGVEEKKIIMIMK